MIDWILIHPEIIFYLCVIMISLIGAGAMTYSVWWLITDYLRKGEEHKKTMAEYRRRIQWIKEDEEDEEVICRVIR